LELGSAGGLLNLPLVGQPGGSSESVKARMLVAFLGYVLWDHIETPVAWQTGMVEWSASMALAELATLQECADEHHEFLDDLQCGLLGVNELTVGMAPISSSVSSDCSSPRRCNRHSMPLITRTITDFQYAGHGAAHGDHVHSHR
jgi:hypothetical protein